jgi:hypothetical protein
MPGMRASALSSVVLVCVAAFVAAAGCGEDEPPTKEEPAGDRIECEGIRCDSVVLPGDFPEIPACCTADGACGLDGTQFEQYGANFEELCQPRNQPGETDDECEASVPVATDFGMLSFTGCCTPAGRCGYLLNSAFTIIQLGLGCVDAQPFLDAGVPANCTPGPGGGGGGGAGGGAGQ